MGEVLLGILTFLAIWWLPIAAAATVGMLLAVEGLRRREAALAVTGFALVGGIVGTVSFLAGGFVLGWPIALLLPSLIAFGVGMYGAGRLRARAASAAVGVALVAIAFAVSIGPVIHTSWQPRSLDAALVIVASLWELAGATLLGAAMERLRKRPATTRMRKRSVAGADVAGAAGLSVLLLAPAFHAALSNLGA